MVTLVILRHAKSAWPDGVADLDRPLGPRGLRDAPVAGQWLNENVPGLDLAVVSPALRARQTWENAAAQLTIPPTVTEDSRIYYGPQLEVVQEMSEDVETAVIVGHNPALEMLTEYLTGRETVFKTSTIAVLRSDHPWSTAGERWAELIDHTTPRG
ncbi:histidine phosphatase family protein [Actinocrispum sp. NPDC049592]|uniref:SixA phosphatase family protein n=1 Tax=Actinocrispum sp. NPDC049592 TaxID=3154835 RepID=UPI0034377F93